MRVDTTPLHGTWSATDEATIGLLQFEMQATGDDALALTAWVAGRTGIVQLADTVAHAYATTAFGSPAASAMTATILADGLSALLTFYLKGEILVLDAFVTPAPGDARLPHYARELFHRADVDRSVDQASRGYTQQRQTRHPRYAVGVGRLKAAPTSETGRLKAAPTRETDRLKAARTSETDRLKAAPTSEMGRLKAAPTGETGRLKTAPTGETGRDTAAPTGETGRDTAAATGYERDASATLDISPLAGEWDNVNLASTDVRRVSLSPADGICLHWASATADNQHWLPIVPFAAAPDSALTIGFTSRMTAAASDAIISGYGTRGILVLDCHTRVGDGRLDHLVREFFSQRSPR